MPGDKARVVRKPASFNGLGWKNVWAASMDKFIGDGNSYLVLSVDKGNGVKLETPGPGYTNTWWFPPEALEYAGGSTPASGLTIKGLPIAPQQPPSPIYTDPHEVGKRELTAQEKLIEYRRATRRFLHGGE